MASLREVDVRYSLGDQGEEVYRLRREVEVRGMEVEALRRDGMLEKEELRAKFD